MRICLCYICVTRGRITDDYAARFVATYRQYPPGHEHDILVIANGGPLMASTAIIFSGLKSRAFPRENDGGWDIGGYVDAANGPCADYDMMLCCGESVYFHRAGWLKRLSDVWSRTGPGMYGSLSSNLVRAHLNTTGFCCPPSALRDYPIKVSSRKDRYEFEHGEMALWRRLSRRGIPVKLVTWDGEYNPRAWRSPPNILWRGDQTNCLMWCQHTDRYVKVAPIVRAKWARGADQPFK